MTEPNRYPYIPDEAFLYFPPQHEIKNGKIRLIFDGGVQLDQEQQQKLREFQQYLAKNSSALQPYWQDNIRIKFLQANNFDFKNTVEAMKEYITWRTTKLIVDDKFSIRKHLEKGMMYFCGRDCNYKPVLVLDIKKISDSDIKTEELINIMGFFYNFIVENMMIEGQVENWVIIIDLGKVGVTGVAGVQKHVIQTMKDCIKFLSHSFRCRMKATYMVNGSWLVSSIWKTAKGLLDQQTAKKVTLYDKPIPDPLFTHTNKSQIEQKFGGTMPNIVNDYWPPKIRSLDFAVGNSKSNLVSKDDYKKMYVSGQLKKRKINANIVSEKMMPSNKVVAELTSQPTFGQLEKKQQSQYRQPQQPQQQYQSQHMYQQPPRQELPQMQPQPPNFNPPFPPQQSNIRQSQTNPQYNPYPPQQIAPQMLASSRQEMHQSNPRIPSINANIGQQSEFRTSSHQIPSLAAVQVRPGSPQLFIAPQQLQPHQPQQYYPPNMPIMPNNVSQISQGRPPTVYSNIAQISSNSVIPTQESIPMQYAPGNFPVQQTIRTSNFQPPVIQMPPGTMVSQFQRPVEATIVSSFHHEKENMPYQNRPHTIFSFDMEADEGCVPAIQHTRLFLKPKNFNSLS